MRVWKRNERRTALAAGVAAAVATALAVAVSSPADSGGGKGQDNAQGKAKNVIFLHGDGMGVAHRELIRLATKGKDGQLVMNQLRYAGLVEHRSRGSRGARDRFSGRRDGVRERRADLQRSDRC